LLLAAGMWTIVGSALAVFGGLFMRSAEFALVAALVPVAIVVGAAKGWFVLRRAAKRVADRIRTRGDDRCLGGFLSWRTWLLVLAMIAAGRLLRWSPIPRPILGAIYLAIGVALTMGSAFIWHAVVAVRANDIENA
jgi:hypothetical protein